MFSLDDKIEVFTDERFSSDAAARHFFASYGEAEVTRKLGELSGLQGEIEKVLKQKVRQNYGLFMSANEEIGKISSEMTELRKLIDSTSGLILEVKVNRTGETSKMKVSSLVPHLSSIRALAAQALTGEFDELPEEMLEKQSKRASMARLQAQSKANITPWILSAPDDLGSLIVEQQYMQAVSVVLKMRGYVNSVKSNTHHTDLTPGSIVGDLVRRVEERAKHLATILHRSLPSIPHSPLWGEEEQKKRVRWLLQLGHPLPAADGFARAQMNLMKCVLRSVEASGDPRQYATEISHTFYALLLRTSLEFKALFGEYLHSPPIMCALFDWTHAQTQRYVRSLAAQIALGTKEHSALCLMQLKPGFDFDSSLSANEPAAAAQHADAIAATKSIFPELPAVFTSQCLEYFDWDVHRCSDALLNENLPPHLTALDPRHCQSGRAGKAIAKGPMTFTMEVLDFAFSEATKLDTSGLQGASCLSWLLLPELQHIITIYAEDVMRDCREQTSNDSWNGKSTIFTIYTPPWDNKTCNYFVFYSHPFC